MRERSSLLGDRSGSAQVSMLAILGGIAFIVAWLGLAGVWAVMSLMGGVMANDAGRVGADRHATLLLVLLVGELLVALAGVSGGLAFFLPDHRATLWWTFAGLLAAGAAMQIWAGWSFLSAAG